MVDFAGVLANRGFKVLFVCFDRTLPSDLHRNPNIQVVPRNNLETKTIGFSDCIGLKNPTIKAGLIACLNYIKAVDVSFCFIDHPLISIDVEEAILHESVKLCVFDDSLTKFHKADVVVCADVFSVCDKFRTENSQSIFLKGFDYHIISKQFALTRRTRACFTIPQVLIYFGNTLEYELVISVLKTMAKDTVPTCFINVIFPDSCGLKGRYKPFIDEKLKIMSPVKNFSEFIASMDLSIGAGGMSSLQRIVNGLPSIVYSLNDEQNTISKMLANQGLIKHLGRKENFDGLQLERAMTHLLRKKNLKDISNKCMNYLDDKGAENIIDALEL